MSSQPAGVQQTPTSTPSNQPQQPRQPPVDPYVADDFNPLSSASSLVLDSLRADESSSDADLYKRLAAGGGGGGGGGGGRGAAGGGQQAHMYRLPAPPDGGAGGRGRQQPPPRNGAASPASAAAAANGGPGPAGSGRGSSGGLAPPFPFGTPGAAAPGGIGGGGGGYGNPQSPAAAAPPGTSPAGGGTQQNNQQQQNQPQPQQQPLAVVRTAPTSTLLHTRTIPLPPYLTHELSTTRLSSLMGLLPAANLAWMSVDERLYVWSYDGPTSGGEVGGGGGGGGSLGGTMNGGGGAGASGGSNQDFCSFSVPSGQCVVSVGLVRPKRGVFKDVVEWCLVVTTPEEAILCALARESTTANSGGGGFGGTATAGGGGRSSHDTLLRLIPTRFVVPTDSVPLLGVCGTADGRIFLGGYDGSLHEMVYEGLFNAGGGGTGNVSRSSVANRRGDVAVFDQDDYDTTYGGDGQPPLYYHPPQSLAGAVLSGTKRALSAAVFGPPAPYSDPSGQQRPRKCRKVNHSAVAPAFVSSVVPGFVLRATSCVFGTGIPGGPIVTMVADEERSTLYGLTSKGFIHAFDLGGVAGASLGSSSSSSSSSQTSPTPPRLACTVDVAKSARLYLDTVARGSLHPPYRSSTATTASICFPGGGAGAQAGVGGMDGARAILKVADAEVQRQRSSGGGAAGSNRGRGGQSAGPAAADGILDPISFHVVPRSESKSLTLVAVTGGGLRYYLTVLPLSSSSSSSSQNLRPGRRFTLCHVRAPPPYTSGPDGSVTFDPPASRSGAATMMMNVAGGGSGGMTQTMQQAATSIAPGLHTSQRRGNRIVVEKGYCGRGAMLLALDGHRGDATATMAGNAIVATTPDYSTSCGNSSNAAVGNATQQSFSGSSSSEGLSEVLLLPMTQPSANGQGSAILPGGRVWDIAQSSNSNSNSVTASPSAALATLFVRSVTPTNSELGVGMVPAYFPPSRIRRRVTATHASEAHSSLAVVANSSNGAAASAAASGVVSTALTVLYRVLLNRQLRAPTMLLSHDPSVSVAGTNGIGAPPTYRVSNRVGCSTVGFSVPADSRKITSNRSSGAVSTHKAGRKSSVRIATRSARLSPWLLSPPVAPLSQLASHHLSAKTKSQVLLALNSGGLHYFATSSLLDALASALMKSTASNIGRDENIRCIFVSYGYAEGCAMCLSLSICSQSDVLKRRAIQAAMSFAHVPLMVPADSVGAPSANVAGGVTGGVGAASSAMGYIFQPSCLHNGLLTLISRLLRPIWFKPAVVVTEGRTIHHRRQYGGYKTTLPAKVELLLDEGTLEEARKPLVALQALMKDIFAPAVGVVPGDKKGQAKGDNDAMEVDENGDGGPHLITRAMQYQSRALPHNQALGQQNAEKDLGTKARLTEERNMHSLYRLVSRSVQLLTLMSHLRRAQSTPELPEVEWGLLHGLTYCQMVTTRSGQDRIETLLTNLLSTGDIAEIETEYDGGGSVSSTVESDNLSAQLSKECYLYFSAGSRLTYQGFRTANAAMSYPPATPRRIALANRAALYFRAAARHWYNPSLVTGRSLHIDVEDDNTREGRRTKTDQWYDDAAMRALEYGSPLARAASVLMDLGCVGGVVDICLVCASNFGGGRVRFDDEAESEKDLIGGNGYTDDMMPWERGLYHRPVYDSTGSGGSDGLQSSSGTSSTTPNSRSTSTDMVVSGIEVTKSDALRTSYAVLFHYLTNLLDSAAQFTDASTLAEQMIAVCSSSSDDRFLRKLYDHLSTEHVEILLRIDSPNLEYWLANEKKDVFLLWRYYVVHGRDWMGGEIMLKRACSVEENVPLDERVECLTRASNSYAAALKKGSNGTGENSIVPLPTALQNGTIRTLQQQRQPPSWEEMNRVLTQLSEQLEIATLQRRILNNIKSSELVSDIDVAKLDVLSNSLVTVSDLYNEYAGPLALYDMCLLILQTCRENDSSSIIKLWKSIICDYTLPCRTRNVAAQEFLSELKRGSMLEEESIILVCDSGEGNTNLMLFEDGDWVPKLKNRIVSLGKELYGKGADFTFPLEVIVKSLEGLRHVYDVSARPGRLAQQPWPLQVLVEVGVGYPAILEAYDSMLELHDRDLAAGGDGIAKWLQNVANVSDVLKQWVTSSLTGTNYTLSTAGGASLVNGSGSNNVNDASVQLQRAVSSGGLLSQIDSYKASLEGCVGGNADEISRVYSVMIDVEEAIKKSM